MNAKTGREQLEEHHPKSWQWQDRKEDPFLLYWMPWHTLCIELTSEGLSSEPHIDQRSQGKTLVFLPLNSFPSKFLSLMFQLLCSALLCFAVLRDMKKERLKERIQHKNHLFFHSNTFLQVPEGVGQEKRRKGWRSQPGNCFVSSVEWAAKTTQLLSWPKEQRASK